VIKQFTSGLGKRIYKTRRDPLGLGRLQEIARDNRRPGGAQR
jgi:hypothetical protein